MDLLANGELEEEGLAGREESEVSLDACQNGKTVSDCLKNTTIKLYLTRSDNSLFSV
jgi:hypothetical protein